MNHNVPFSAVDVSLHAGPLPADDAEKAAQCAVARYLEDVGLRDPSLVARESQRIVAEASATRAVEEARETLLSQRAIALAVKQLDRWLLALAEEATSAATRLWEVFDTEPAIADRPDAVDLDTCEGRVRFEGVQFAYPNLPTVLAAMSDSPDRVAVSGPSRWYSRGTVPMRRAHWVIERRLGRAVARYVLRTRISSRGWNPVPEAPYEVAGRISPTPLLIVHGDADAYFPLEHAEKLYAAANEPKDLWVEAGFGHAENAAPDDLVRRIGAWLAAHRDSPGAGRVRP